MRDTLCMVVPVWFPADMPAARMAEFLTRTLADCELFVRPGNIALVIDGCPQAVEPAQKAALGVAERTGEAPLILDKAENEGQGGAVCHGFEHFLHTTGLEFFCARDADGDHDIYDLPQLFRLLEEMLRLEETDCAYVIGHRGSLHRPMGFDRGEYETLLNRLTLRAVEWALAQQGRTTDLRYCRRLPWPPDFQSGYKLYTRRTAEMFCAALRRADAACPADEVLRWGIQFVSTVELLAAGVAAGSVYRLTYDEQPQSTFENADNRVLAYGRQFAWLFAHLQIPAAVAFQWWDEAILTLNWGSVGGGWQELLEIRRYLAEQVYSDTPPPPSPARHIMF